jgi:nitronate monooxygenase
MLLDECPIPVVLAPLAGGPSTPELAAAVTEAGGLGFLAGGYLSASALGEQIARTRELTAGPFGVNVFVPQPAGNPTAVEAYILRLESEASTAGVTLGEPRQDDDDWAGKLASLIESPVPLVSFTFGCPPVDVIVRLHAVGSEVWVTVTDPDEARQAQSAGADALVVQGFEAGGHRGGFSDVDQATGLLALLQVIAHQVSLPLVAAGGIATGHGLAAVIAAGARAGALGSAFLRCPEAGTSQVYRDALADPRPTATTRAFTGRLARGLRNRFLDEHTPFAPSAYPQIHHVTAPLRAHGRAVDDPEVVNMWAGQAYALGQAEPAADVVRRTVAEARAALDRAATLLR